MGELSSTCRIQNGITHTTKEVGGSSGSFNKTQKQNIRDVQYESYHLTEYATYKYDRKPIESDQIAYGVNDIMGTEVTDIETVSFCNAVIAVYYNINGLQIITTISTATLI